MTRLPRFKSPPVVEAVLSVQFNTIGLTNALSGLFWGEVRGRYNAVVEQAPLPPAFETFGTDATQSSNFAMPFWAASSSRYWFVSLDEIDVLQLQQDRVVRNWRKRTLEQNYPGYFEIKRIFEQDLAQVASFAERENLGAVIPNQCEVSYTSIITPPNEADAGKDMSRVTSICPSNPIGPDGAVYEGSNTQARFQLTGNDGQPIGRLYAAFAPQIAPDGRAVIRADILARGRPPTENISGALDFLDLLHSSAVRSFLAMTSPEMHKIWELERGV